MYFFFQIIFLIVDCDAKQKIMCNIMNFLFTYNSFCLGAPYNRPGNYRDMRGPQRFDRGPRNWGQLPVGRNPRDRRPPPPPVSGGRDWMRNNRGREYIF